VIELIAHARRDLQYGAARTRVWLQRVHHKSYPVKTIHRAFVRLGMPRLASRKKRGVKPRQLRLFEMPHGTEFPLAFALSVRAAGMRHRYIKPRCPEQNGKVERSQRIDSEEFWSRETFTAFEDAARAVRRWEHHYNWQRFWTVLKGETPGEKLQRLIPGVCAA